MASKAPARGFTLLRMRPDPEWVQRIGADAAMTRRHYQLSCGLMALWCAYVFVLVLVTSSMDSSPERTTLGAWLVSVMIVSIIPIQLNYWRWRKRLIYDAVRAMFLASRGRVRNVSERTLASMSRFDNWTRENSLPWVSPIDPTNTPSI